MKSEKPRSLHALQVDRGIQARKVYDSRNDQYEQSPNRSDAEDWDTKYTSTKPPVTPKGEGEKPNPKTFEETEEEEARQGYVPSDEERKRLIKIFHSKLDAEEQHKDLMVTKNVIRKKEDLKKWEDNPKFYDVRTVDTRVKGLYEKRLEVAQKYGKISGIGHDTSGFRMGTRGQYTQSPLNPLDMGTLNVRKNLGYEKYHVIGHELGHAIDRNVWNPKEGKKLTYDDVGNKPRNRVFVGLRGWTTGNINFGRMKKKEGEIGSKEKNFMKSNRDKVRRLTETHKHIDPFPMKRETMLAMGGEAKQWVKYRDTNSETFANWFGGFMTHPEVTRKHTRGFYNTFRKANPELIKGLKRAEREATRPFIKVLKPRRKK